MRNMLLIARREYIEQIGSRGFRMSTLGLPVLFAAILFIAYSANRGTGSHKHYIIASTDAALAGAVRDQLDNQKQTHTRVDIVDPTAPGEFDTINRLVRTKAVSGALIITPHPDSLPTADYYSNSSGDFITGAKLADAIDKSIVDTDLTAQGMPPTAAAVVVKGVTVKTWQIKKDGSIIKSNALAAFWKGYVMAFLLSITTLVYGLNVARSIIQEKTSRIFEVMLATVKPSDMLAGKLLGVGAVGLTQILIWVIAAAALLATPLAAGLLSGQYAVRFSWTEGILFPVYFVLGFLLYSSLFAGLAATCETEQELQLYTPLAAAPTWLSFALIVVIMNDSNSRMSIAASLFPPTAPIVMFLRMAAEIPPAWQFAVSIGLLLLSIWVVLLVSSRLYRVGILMYGKRATLPELIRWLRYS
jgi:ABC-2 type transport system permease protein